MTRSRFLRLTALSALLAVVAAGTLAQQSPAPRTPLPPRGVDYWQPDWMVRELWGPGQVPKGMMVRMLRHSIFMQFGVPKAYEGVVSTISPGPQTLAAGRDLYNRNCASCHGADGMGSGDPGKAVSPSPALLAYMIRRPISVDEYLLWVVSDGGKQFESDMPAFKDALSRDDIWRIVAYMRAGFPQAEGDTRK